MLLAFRSICILCTVEATSDFIYGESGPTAGREIVVRKVRGLANLAGLEGEKGVVAMAVDRKK